MILIIDNYDSFTYNLYQYAARAALNKQVRVIKNDEMTATEAAALNPSHVIISPGSGRPKDAGMCEELIRLLEGRVPVLGVCLGHQAICERFGARITYASKLVHGKAREAYLAAGCPLFKGLPPQLKTGRYHSLAVAADSLPDCLMIIAEDDGGEIMGVRHTEFAVFGLQFHPESILTEHGYEMIVNFLKIKENYNGREAE